MKKNISIMFAALAMSLSAMAQSTSVEATASPSISEAALSTTINQAVYGKIGFPGVGLGYAYGVNKNFGIRGDITTIGSYSADETSGDLSYKAKLKYHQAGVYGDYFPSAGNFRVTAGLQFRDAKVTGEGRPNIADQLTIGNTTVLVDQNDRLSAQIKMPTVAPYIGIGWGLNTAASSAGWSFFADLGVTIGKPKVSINVNDSLMGKLEAAAVANGTTAQGELDKQVRELKSDSDKLKVVPQIFVGVAYKF